MHLPPGKTGLLAQQCARFGAAVTVTCVIAVKDLATQLFGETCIASAIKLPNGPAARELRGRIMEVSCRYPGSSARLHAHQTWPLARPALRDRKSTRLNSSHLGISYAV